jgi:PAS domain S-box-containing protein
MEQRVISVDDTRRDPRMVDFPTDYLEREGILAILAAPIRAGDRVFGIFCNENKGEVRTWTIEEQAFAASMSDLAALVFLMAEQRGTQNKWREARDYFDKIINAVADPIFVKDREHRWVLLNDAYCDFMGYKREELLGKTDRDFFPETEADFFWKKDDMVFERGEEVLSEERFTDAQGRAHVIMTKKVLYTDEKGQKFIVGVIRDVTDLKKAEEDREKQIHDLEIFYKASVGREQRIIELKARVQELEARLKETKET